MAKPKSKDISADEFLLWCLDQDERYELVDGVVVPLRAMAGASTAHDRIVSNISGALYAQIKGSGCLATTPQTALRTAITRIRRPDVTIECAPPEPRSYEVRNPVAIFEVLSPSTQRSDKLIKLPEHLHHPDLRTIVLVEPDCMEVVVYQRDDKGEWQGRSCKSPEPTIALDGTAATISFADIYGAVPVSVRDHGGPSEQAS